MLKSRILYGLFFLFTVILGFYKDGFLSTLLFYVAVLLPVASLAHIFYSHSQFRLSERLSQRTVVKGDGVRYGYEIHNNTPFLFCFMTIRYLESDLLFKESILSQEETFILMPFQARKEEKNVVCRYRGLYYMGIATIEFTDYFGLFKVPFRVSDHPKILVYPLIRDLLPFNFTKSVHEVAESIVGREKENKSVFTDIRDYELGDPLKQVHWKLSAKKQAWLTKTYQGQVSYATTILINTDGLSFSYEASIILQDHVIEGAVAMIRQLLFNNAQVTLGYHKTDLELFYGEHLNEFDRFYEPLAKLMFSQEIFAKSILEQYYGQYIKQSQVMIFTPLITEAMVEFFKQCPGDFNQVQFFIVDPHHARFQGRLDGVSLAPMYQLLDMGYPIYKIQLENGYCRLEVA